MRIEIVTIDNGQEKFILDLNVSSDRSYTREVSVRRHLTETDEDIRIILHSTSCRITSTITLRNV